MLPYERASFSFDRSIDLGTFLVCLSACSYYLLFIIPLPVSHQIMSGVMCFLFYQWERNWLHSTNGIHMNRREQRKKELQILYIRMKKEGEGFSTSLLLSFGVIGGLDGYWDGVAWLWFGFRKHDDPDL